MGRSARRPFGGEFGGEPWIVGHERGRSAVRDASGRRSATQIALMRPDFGCQTRSADQWAELVGELYPEPGAAVLDGKQCIA